MTGTLSRPLILLAAGAIALLGIASTVIAASGTASGDTSLVGSTVQEARVTKGVPPIARLPHEAIPLAAVARGDGLAIVARPSGTNDLVLFRMARDGSVTAQHSTGLRALGVRLGLAAAPDDSVWVGFQSSLVRIASDGTLRNFALPPARHPLPDHIRGVAPGGRGFIDDGQVTALAWSADSLFIGRAGHLEITRLRPATGAFDAIDLAALGDVGQFAVAGDSRVFFTVNHSATQPGSLADKVGVLDPANGKVAAIALRALAVSAGAASVVTSGIDGISLLEGPVPVARPLASAGRYDRSRVAMRSDGATAARAAGGQNEIVFIDVSGREIARTEYQVPLIRDPGSGKSIPYASAFVFAVGAVDGSVWFALYGSPAIYRIPG